MLIITSGPLVEPEGLKIRHITNRAFLTRLAPWWPFIEFLKTNSADFRLDWALLELAGYVDLDAPENTEAFTRLGQAIDALRNTEPFNAKEYPVYDLKALTVDGTEREAYRGAL